MRSRIARFAMRRRGTVVAALVLLLALTGTAIAGTGRGADLELGVTNTINGYLTTLRGSFTGPMFQVTNTGTGRGIGITVAAGKAPIVVNATAGKAVNLNADKVDGLTSSQLQKRAIGVCGSGTAVGSINADGTVVCNAGVPLIGFGAGFSSVPSTATTFATIAFVTGTAPVNVAAGQTVLVTSTAALGSTVGADSLQLYVCSKPTASTVLTSHGGGSFGLQVAANTRHHFTLSVAMTGLAAGSYEVGLCGYATTPANWNSTEWGSTTAVVARTSGGGIMSTGTSPRR